MNKILKLSTVYTISLLCALTQSTVAASSEQSPALSVLSGRTGSLVDTFLDAKQDRDNIRALCKTTRDDRNHPKPEGVTSGIGYRRTVVNLTVPDAYSAWKRISPSPTDYAGIFGTPGLLESARTLTATADLIAGSRGFYDIERLSNLNHLIIPYAETPYFIDVVRLLHGVRSTLTSLSLQAKSYGNILDTMPLSRIGFERLSSLSLENCHVEIASIRNLAGLPHLTALYLRSLMIREDALNLHAAMEHALNLHTAIASLTNLRKLAISHNPYIGDVGAATIANLHNLRELDLLFTDVGDVGATALATLPNLERLSIVFNRIGNAGATALAAMPRLVGLNLYMNPDISEDMKDALSGQHPFIRF